MKSLWPAASPVLFALILASVPAVRGQEQLITGVISDSTGAVVPKVSVTIANVETGLQIKLLTNSQGEYRSVSLKVGEYRLEVSARGFESLVRTGITLHLAEILRVDLQLRIGNVAETVEVTGAAPILNTEDPRLGEVIEHKAVESLPLQDRRAGGLIALAPGVYYEGQDAYSFYAPRLNIGASGNFVLSLDGALVSVDRMTADQMALNPPQESIQEVQVQTSYYGPEYGGAEGGMVRMLTRSGTNQLHGSLYEYARNDVFDSRQFFAAKRQADHYHLFGGSVGGPIRKDRVFFFANVEGNTGVLPASGSFTVPTLAMQKGDFSSVPQQIYNPATTRPDPAQPARYLRDPFPGNIIPQQLVDSVAVKALAVYPQVTQPGANNFSGVWKNKIGRKASATKIDYQLNPKDTLTGSWFYDRVNLNNIGLNGFTTPAAIPDPQGSATSYMNQSFIFSETHIFSPALVNSARFAFRPQWWTNVPATFDPNGQWDAKLGIKNISRDLGFPVFAPSGYMTIGNSAGAGFPQDPVNSTEISESVTYSRGKHTMKFGVDLQRSLHAEQRRTAPEGSFAFDQRLSALPGVANTGNSIASLLLGNVTTGSISDIGQLTDREWYMAPYFADTIRLTRKLTLNLGVRWEFDLPTTVDPLQGSSFDPNAINPVSNTRGVITFLGRDGQPGNFYNTDMRRIEPRIGFAYQLDKKTVIRGGYGLYGVDLCFGQTGVATAPSLGFNNTASFSTQDNGLTPAFLLQNGFPTWTRGGNIENLNAGYGAVRVGQNPTTSPTFVNRNLILGYSENFNLSVQRELPRQILFEVAGMGALGRKIPVWQDLNQLPSNLWGSTGNTQVLRPFPQFGSITNLKTPAGTSDYYGLTLNGTKRLSSGLLFISNFTWQKGLGKLGLREGQLETNGNPGLSRGPVIFNNSNSPTGVEYRMFRFTWAYDLPFGPGRRFSTSGPLSVLLGGWNIGGIWTLYSGQPFTLSVPTNSLNCFCPAGTRLNVLGTAQALNAGPRKLSQWFDTRLVAPPVFGQVGNMGPGILTGPALKNLDASISKTTRFKERYEVKLAWELFNFTNTAKFGNPGSSYGSSSFGVISGYRGVGTGSNVSPPWFGARIMQLGLRFAF
jgi:hypothetical protein